jgi:uncharacterized protein (TIGR04255 family)
VATGLPEYDDPPVVETVLSAQFARLSSFTAVHAAWFLKSQLDASWTKTQEVPRLPDVFERFGSARIWLQNEFRLIQAGSQSSRLQITRNDDERMLQLQDSRFIQNWRKEKGGAGYPSYRKLLPEFKDHLSRFEAFASAEKLGSLQVNQWEITYVNLLPRGGLWNSPQDLPKIFPWFGMPITGLAAVKELDAFGSGEWSFELADQAGRLYVSMAQVRIGSPVEAHETINLQLTARGPTQPDRGIDLFRGLDIGHDAIVRAFTAMTSGHAHKIWRRRI